MFFLGVSGWFCSFASILMTDSWSFPLLIDFLYCDILRWAAVGALDLMAAAPKNPPFIIVLVFQCYCIFVMINFGFFVGFLGNI